MTKSKPMAAAIVAAFLLAAPSQAASRSWTPFSEPAALFAKIERWWALLFNGLERPARQEPSERRQKNGCGIDPNGQPLCPGPGTTQPTGGK